MTKLNFGITKETRVNSATPILVAKKVENNPTFPNGWEFPIAKLVNVVAKENYEKRDGSLTDTLQFVFVDKDNRQHIHTEYKLEEDDDKITEKLEGMSGRIGHIYASIFGSVPESGLGTGAESFFDFFKKVEEAFNSQVITVGEGEEARQVKKYTSILVYIKLTYYKTRLGFPLSPNFLEKVINGKPCLTLKINPSDSIEPKKVNKPSGIPGMGDAPSGDAIPTFDQGFTG